jgi:cyclic pyranopterin phosphate synthase
MSHTRKVAVQSSQHVSVDNRGRLQHCSSWFVSEPKLWFVRFAEQRSLEVRFIEFMPFLSNDWRTDVVVPYREILESINQRFQLQALPGEITDVAKRFSIGESGGTVGFVTSVTDSFCGGCNRLRLTSEGLFKTCLFLPPKLSLRDMLRNQTEESVIVNAIRDELNTKWAAHPPMDRWQQRDTLTMVQIGG